MQQWYENIAITIPSSERSRARAQYTYLNAGFSFSVISLKASVSARSLVSKSTACASSLLAFSRAQTKP